MSIDFFQLLRLVRLFDAIFPLVSLFLGFTAGGSPGHADILLLAALVLIMNSVAMVWNDIEDRQIDADNGRPALMALNKAQLRQLRLYTLALIILALVLALMISNTVFILSLIPLFIIWSYNSKPIQASRRPIASIIVLSGAGAFLPYILGLSVGSISIETLIASIFWWIGRISLSVLKDYKDAYGDARHHKKTFLLRYGARWVARVSVTCFLVGYIGFISIMKVHTDRSWVLPILGLAIAVLVYMRRRLFVTQATYKQLDGVFRTVAQYQLLLDTGIVLWLM